MLGGGAPPDTDPQAVHGSARGPRVALLAPERSTRGSLQTAQCARAAYSCPGLLARSHFPSDLLGVAVGRRHAAARGCPRST
ncbi:hypothetical protein NDU88_004823 [Pleurodeles waltl]|uniref:Uncharacterized protein n=1 Tax=Pleurodeles waltl TaxID=8319 RepID=A0AAV7UGA3_PLEWA|nr:hypothetical protein NDU88_004823 [Pleurodeles waltl]